MYGPAPSPPVAATTAEPVPSVTRDLAAVAVARIPDRPGQELRNELTDRLNPARLEEPKRYALNVSLRRTVRELGIDRSGLATRGNLTMTARFSLTEVASGKVLLTSGARSVVGYDLLAGQPTSYFSTLVATQDAQSRAITQIAGQMVARLGAFFDRHPQGAGGPAAGGEVQPAFGDDDGLWRDGMGPESDLGGGPSPVPDPFVPGP